jgi:hypothetical protein
VPEGNLWGLGADALTFGYDVMANDGLESVPLARLKGFAIGFHAGFVEIGYQVGSLVDFVFGTDTANDEVRDWAWGLTDLGGTTTQRIVVKSSKVAVNAAAAAASVKLLTTAWTVTGGATYSLTWDRGRHHFGWIMKQNGQTFKWHWLPGYGINSRSWDAMMNTNGPFRSTAEIPILFPVRMVLDTTPGTDCIFTALKAFRIGFFGR